MPNLPEHIELKFFEILSENFELSKIESWVYSADELETLLSPDDYFELLAFDYKRTATKHELIKLVSKQILDHAKFEKWYLLGQLNEALKRNDNLPHILKGFYDLYCHGYYFLDDLAFRYGLQITLPNSGNENWIKKKNAEQKGIIDGFYPEIESYLNQAIGWIEDGKIELIGDFEYIDNRTLQEKKSIRSMASIKQSSSFYKRCKGLLFPAQTNDSDGEFDK